MKVLYMQIFKILYTLFFIEGEIDRESEEEGEIDRQRGRKKTFLGFIIKFSYFSFSFL